MANTIEYIFSLQDKISAKIGNITITTDKMLGKFADLEKKTNSVTKTFNETGRSLGSLREKIALLQAEREWIPAENIEGIRAYNREMKALNKEVTKLESLNGGKFQKWSKEAFSAMPGANLISNPLVAGGAALGFAGKSAMNYDEGMAKVNITAQLDEKGLTDLSGRLRQLAKDNHTDVTVAPVGLEKIISQVGDADLSMQILDASLKGSKAGFTDLDTVSGALAQSLSVIGKENTNAKEVLDTFFAAKRVGAGEFADFARYMPGLIAGASNMGINFKEVAGTFAYMTGKGQTAERAAVLMENAFAMLGKSDIRGKMEKAGVKVFDDQGKMRGMVDIFTDMSGVLSGMTDEQKSSILESLGLTDKEAKNAFALMTSDLGKLQEAMDATSNATGETEKAMTFSQNAIQKATGLWNDFKNIGNDVGMLILPIINVGLDVLSIVLGGLSFIIKTVLDLFTWWNVQLQNGNPIIWGVTAAITALSAALLINYARANAVFLITKAKTVWDGIQAGATWLLTGAQWAFNTALYACPLTWIVLIIGVVVAAIVACWNKFEGFRKFIMSMWEVMKEFGRVLVESIVGPFKQVLKGVDGVCMALVQLIGGNFKEAAAAAKEGFKDIGEGMMKGSPIGVAVNVAQKGKWGEAWDKGQQKGADPQHNPTVKPAPVQMIPGTQLPAQVDQSPEAKFGVPIFFDNQKKTNVANTPDVVPDAADVLIPQAPATNNFEEIQKRLGEDGKKKTDGASTKVPKAPKVPKAERVLNLNDDDTGKDAIRNLPSSADYTAVTRKLTPAKVDLAPAKDHLLAASGKVTDARQRFADAAKKPDESKQEYAPEKSDFLKDIMMNVRKIAAVGAIPLAISLSSPTMAEAKMPEPVVSEMTAPEMRIPEWTAPTVSVPELTAPKIRMPELAALKADIPELSVPQLSVPKLTAPEMRVPEMATPTVSVPELTSPKIRMPELAALKADIPELSVPKLTAPEMRVPEMATPELRVPELAAPTISVPELTAPKIQMPELAALKADIPKLSVPQLTAPKLTAPEMRVPEMATPTVSVPELTSPKVQMPELAALKADIPELNAPKLTAPEIRVPEIAIPKIAVPEMKVPQLPQARIPEMASIATPSPEVYNYESSEKISERSERFENKETTRDTGKTITMDHFCDQIVIHIQNTDGKGQETIRQEVMKAINELLEG